MVGAVGIEIASLIYKPFKANGVAPPPPFQLEPFGAKSVLACAENRADSSYYFPLCSNHSFRCLAHASALD
jgi:hypothetical protein